MLYAIYVLLGVTVSWMVGFLFVRFQLIKALYNSLIAGFTASILSYVLIHLNNTHLIYPTLLLVYIIMMPLILVQRTDRYMDSIFAFLIAAGMEVVALFSFDRLTMFVGQTIAICMSVVVIAMIGFAMYSEKSLFPEEDDWMECFKERVNEEHTCYIKIYHVYLLLACAFVVPAVGLAFIYLTTIGGTIVAVMAIIILYMESVYGAVYLINHKKLQISIGIERQYRNDMQSFMNIIRSQRHDYSFHVQTLAGLFNNNNLEACRKYVNELVADSVAMNTMLPIEDPAIAAMINSFRILAAREEIEIHIDIQNDLSMIVTNAYETNKIISNLLQNAIDEVKTHTVKSYGIWLYIFKRGEYCNISVANELEQTQEEQFKSLFQHGYTTKTGHDGVGLSSIQSLAKRYHGLVYFFLEENVIHFVAEIPIQVV